MTWQEKGGPRRYVLEQGRVRIGCPQIGAERIPSKHLPAIVAMRWRLSIDKSGRCHALREVLGADQ